MAVVVAFLPLLLLSFCRVSSVLLLLLLFFYSLCMLTTTARVSVCACDGNTALCASVSFLLLRVLHFSFTHLGSNAPRLLYYIRIENICVYALKAYRAIDYTGYLSDNVPRIHVCVAQMCCKLYSVALSLSLTLCYMDGVARFIQTYSRPHTWVQQPPIYVHTHSHGWARTRANTVLYMIHTH